jgi:DNA-binding response OmpR family regulator
VAGERILVVEDERAVARGLVYGLEAEGFAVTWAETGERALEVVRAVDPHLVLLDIRLPGISGFDVCRRLRAQGWRMPVLMLTARDDEVDVVLGLEIGADDYVTKPYSLRALVSRIRALVRRAYGELADAAGGDRIAFGDVEIDTQRLLVTRGGARVDLTPTEFRLLCQLAANRGRPQTRAALVEAVWGYDSEIGDLRTVDVHVRHLREKLENDPSAPRWLVTVRGTGYMCAQ